ncbi:transcription termination/antitermination protein NusG [Roseinatronobacter sp.]|uniref:transcription termination/antitermination protein NusG n=1 Tax=Roseinatronobacter sp. TaxID=1945755 RepID=UPI0025DBB9E3|nr:transcriptional activator RfaH [Roseibaca sp.]
MLNAQDETLPREASDLQWFAGQLKPNGLSLAELNLARQGIESFCPWMIETKRREGKLQDFRRPLFPGYIFVRIDPKAGLWRTVNATRGLTRLVQTDPRAPTPLPNDLIAGLRARCSDNGELHTGPELSPGDMVRVVAGPFVDFVAKIETIGEDARIRVLFELMNRKVVTALDPAMLRKLE